MNEFPRLSDISDKEMARYRETPMVKQKCSMCGEEVYKARKQKVSRCFDCRQKKLQEYASNSHKRKQSAKNK